MSESDESFYILLHQIYSFFKAADLPYTHPWVIPAPSCKHNLWACSIVDEIDYVWMIEYNWYSAKKNSIYTPYWAVTRSQYVSPNKNHTVLMAREVLEAKLELEMVDLEVDHINGCSLDNRRSNLRLATRKQNHANQKKPKVRKSKIDLTLISKYKGVRINRLSNGSLSYRANVDMEWLKERGLNTGICTFEMEAAKMYDEFAKCKFGEFARLNFPEQKIKA